ncbi:MAG: sensor histidine kinase [Flavobacteriales bacterium]|nr:sensor histidine kinase [Flavobacteriales bacterium]
MQRTYARSTDLVERNDKVAMGTFLDSLRNYRDRSETDRVLFHLLDARWMRHTGRNLDAHHLFDTIAVDTLRLPLFLIYLRHYQHAKTLKAMEVFDMARVEAQKARRAAEGMKMLDEALEMDLLISEIDLHNDEFERALHGFDRLLERATALHHTEGICRALTGMGNTYYHQEQDSIALGFYQRTLDTAQAHSEPELMIGAIHNIGAALTYTQGSEAAIALYRAVLDTAGPGMHTSLRADLLTNLASMYSDIDEHAQANAVIDEALAIYAGKHDTASMAGANLFKATALWELGLRDQALEQVMLARSRTAETHLQARAAQKAARYLQAMGRPAEAYGMLAEHSQLADSLARRKYSDGVGKAQVRFETAEKERRIVQQQQALERTRAEGERRALQRNILIGSTLLLGIIALLLTRTIRSRQRLAQKETELHHEQVDQLLSQQEIKSINAMLEGQEKERDRMSKDLHDRLGSMLGGIKANMAALEDRVEEMRQDQQYQKVNRLLDHAVGELRQISHDMAAATLNRFGLEKALKDLRETLHINGRLNVELNTFGLDDRLERSVELALYRMVQELVSNVLKHAKARELSIAVTRSPGRLSLVVADDGIGFDTSVPNEGIGLSNVRSRAAALSASVHVDSTPGKGTTVSIECPVVE